MLKTKARRLFSNFLNAYGKEPQYACCKIEFIDDHSSIETVFALDSGIAENDDQIFYYCDSLNDLLSLMDKEEKSVDFIITDIYEFLGTL